MLPPSFPTWISTSYMQMVQQEILGDYSDLPNMLKWWVQRLQNRSSPETHPNVSQWEQNSRKANSICSQAYLLEIHGFHLFLPFYVKGIWNNSNLPQRILQKKNKTSKPRPLSAADLASWAPKSARTGWKAAEIASSKGAWQTPGPPTTHLTI